MKSFGKNGKIYFLIFCVIGISLIPIFLSAETLTVTIISPSAPQCSDGLDNDNDNLIDYPNDPGCGSADDNDETDPPSCGDGSCNGSETCESCSSDCGSCPSSSGGGGGGAAYTPVTRVIFSGRAYPNSSVTLLKDAQVAATTIAGRNSMFQIDLSGISAGNYMFSIYGEDKAGRRSSLLTFPISVTMGTTVNVSGVFIAPTIALDKSDVRQGDNLAIFGQSVPQGEIVILVNSKNEIFKKVRADSVGAYLYNLDTTVLEEGDHFVKSKAKIDEEISSFGRAINFTVGKTVADNNENVFIRGDLNSDGRVNLIDFSIMAYWYKRPISAEFKKKEKAHFNGDGLINLVDFSILAYYWTG